jgi:hypothetical protein
MQRGSWFWYSSGGLLMFGSFISGIGKKLIGGALTDIAMPAISSAVSYKSAKDTNKQNRQMAADQMAFQERMSNSAFQRQREDLKAAGYNPILAMKGSGASSPGGASAQMQDAGAAARQAAIQTATLQQIKAATFKLKEEGVAAAHNSVTAAANTIAAQQQNQLRDMDIQALKRMGLGPMQLQYAPWNQIGSMAIDKAGDLKNKIDKAGKWLGNSAFEIRSDAEAELKKRGIIK